MRQTRLLTKLELCNLYGLNIIRKTKDTEFKKKARIFGVIIALILAMVLSYIVALCAGLAVLGAADVIPAYLIFIASFFTVFFDVFKIGGVIFRQKGYDMISSLPLSDGAVVVSRFVRMYVESLIVAVLIFAPGLTVYAVFEHPAISFYLLAVLVIATVPLLPLALSVFLGTLITAASSRMKHKAMAEAGFSLLLVIGVLVLSMRLSGVEDDFSLEMLKQFSETATRAMEKAYPPAVAIGRAMTTSGVVECIVFAVVSVLVTAAVMWIVKQRFHAVCRSLYTTVAKHNYAMGHLKQNSVRKALLIREARRYFASGPYVSNTIIGPVLGAVMGVILACTDVDQMIVQFTAQIPDSVNMNVKGVIPLLIAAVMSMMNVVCISVSMEGKQWWISKNLPLSARMIFDAKLLFNLLLIAPFYVVAEICVMLALRPGIFEAVWILLLPALLIVFSCVFGLRINLLFPKMDWENETVAVKQSAASFLGGIGGTVVALLLALLILLLPGDYYNVLCMAETLLLAGMIVLLYRKNNRVLLEDIS
ncbi:MAG: hypothetical protein E7289_07355 [Lachnospiraceae bacterium]|nr:hypothetical protein [Lachnospiraceae bacterium]